MKFFTRGEIVYTRRVADKRWTVLVVDDCEKTARLIKKELKGVAEKCGADGFVHKESFLGKEALAELLRRQRESE